MGDATPISLQYQNVHWVNRSTYSQQKVPSWAELSRSTRVPDDEVFCGIVDRRKSFSLISSRDHRQRFSPSRISDMPRAGFEPVQNLSSGCVEWCCAVVITTTPYLTFLFIDNISTDIETNTFPLNSTTDYLILAIGFDKFLFQVKQNIRILTSQVKYMLKIRTLTILFWQLAFF